MKATVSSGNIVRGAGVPRTLGRALALAALAAALALAGCGGGGGGGALPPLTAASLDGTFSMCTIVADSGMASGITRTSGIPLADWNGVGEGTIQFFGATTFDPATETARFSFEVTHVTTTAVPLTITGEGTFTIDVRGEIELSGTVTLPAVVTPAAFVAQGQVARELDMVVFGATCGTEFPLVAVAGRPLAGLNVGTLAGDYTWLMVEYGKEDTGWVVETRLGLLTALPDGELKVSPAPVGDTRWSVDPATGRSEITHRDGGKVTTSTAFLIDGGNAGVGTTPPSEEDPGHFSRGQFLVFFRQGCGLDTRAILGDFGAIALSGSREAGVEAPREAPEVSGGLANFDIFSNTVAGDAGALLAFLGTPDCKGKQELGVALFAVSGEGRLVGFSPSGAQDNGPGVGATSPSGRLFAIAVGLGDAGDNIAVLGLRRPE